MISTTNHDISQLDRQIPSLQMSVRQMLMKWTIVTPTGPKPLFVRIGPDLFNSGGYTFIFPVAYINLELGIR